MGRSSCFYRLGFLLCFTAIVLIELTIPCHSWPLPSSSSSSSSLPSTTTTTTTTTTATTTTMAHIQNFRRARGIGNIYRCASPDILGEQIMRIRGIPQEGITHHRRGRSSSTNHPNHHHRIIMDESPTQEEEEQQQQQEQDRFVLEQAHLVLDLRSPSERNEVHSKMWMNQVGMRIFESDEDYQTTGRRCVVRIDVLSPPKFMKYIDDHWLSSTPSEKAQVGWYKLVDGRKLHELRIERLNDYGLAGLNEAILETGQMELCRALQTITLHLEQNPGQSAVIHCVQGKDRTGMLVMLLQSLMGVSDRDIIADYFQSNQMILQSSLHPNNNEGSAAIANSVRIRGKMDRREFAGTNEKAVISTLHFLRGKYGSVSPGYLDAIGFDESWRNRLTRVLLEPVVHAAPSTYFPQQVGGPPLPSSRL